MEKCIYNFFNKTKGVISVFLVIILVPIVTACCLYVDSSRIKLAQSVIESSGDLALNTVLSNFDADLAEIYGLMASAQSDKEIKKNAKDYFKKSMISQGLEDTYADEFSNVMSGLLMGESFDTVNDLLGIATTNVEITPVTDGNLTNPTLMKQQIVEFMKYRGPVEGISELWENFSKIKNSVDDSKEIAKLTEDANEYYEHESDALKQLEEAYNQLLNYNDVHNSQPGTFHTISGINEDYINTIKERITSNKKGSIYSDYKKWHRDYVMDLCTYTKYNLSQKAFKKPSIKTPDSVVINNVNKISLNQLNQKIKGLQTAYSNYNTYATSLNNLNTALPYKKNTTYDIQYWIQMQNELQSSKNNYLLSKFLNRYDGNNRNSIAYKIADIEANAEKFDIAELKSESAILPVGASNSSEQSYYSCIFDQNGFIRKVRNEYRSDTTYQSIVNNVFRICNNNKASIDNEKDELTNGVSRIQKELNDYKSDMADAQRYLSLAWLALRNAKSAIEKMNTSFDTWEADYNASNNRVKNQDEIKKQYREAENDINNLGLTPDKIEVFKDRVHNVQKLIKDVDSAINNFKYKNTEIYKIKSFDAFANASLITTNDISTIKSELQKKAESTFKVSFPNVSNCGISDNNNPNFMVKPPEVYLWMQSKFVDKKGNMIDPRHKSSEREEMEDEYDTKVSKEKSSTDDVKTDGQNNSGKDIKGIDGLPSAGKDTDSGVEVKVDDKKNISNMSDAVGNLFNGFAGSLGETLEDLAIETRDDLYLLLYISNMFTYDTFESEKKYEKEQNGGTEDKYARYTLTNHPMNAENNYAYCGEIEYIIYGNTNSLNKAASYGTIFAIRYALDLLYAMTNFWSATKTITGGTIDAFATGIQTATAGVIPAPLTKLIVILALTGMEAANDLKILREGNPLALLKDDDVWYWQFRSSDFGEGNNDIKDNNRKKDLTFQYSDYLKLILMMKLIANDTPILKRTADVIQVNMDKKQSGFKMSNCHVYYQLTANCKNSIMMLALPVVQGSLKDSNIDVKNWNEYSITMYRGY